MFIQKYPIMMIIIINILSTNIFNLRNNPLYISTKYSILLSLILNKKLFNRNNVEYFSSSSFSFLIVFNYNLHYLFQLKTELTSTPLILARCKTNNYPHKQPIISYKTEYILLSVEWKLFFSKWYCIFSRFQAIN